MGGLIDSTESGVGHRKGDSENQGRSDGVAGQGKRGVLTREGTFR